MKIPTTTTNNAIQQPSVPQRHNPEANADHPNTPNSANSDNARNTIINPNHNVDFIKKHPFFSHTTTQKIEDQIQKARQTFKIPYLLDLEKSHTLLDNPYILTQDENYQGFFTIFIFYYQYQTPDTTATSLPAPEEFNFNVDFYSALFKPSENTPGHFDVYDPISDSKVKLSVSYSSFDEMLEGETSPEAIRFVLPKDASDDLQIVTFLELQNNETSLLQHSDSEHYAKAIREEQTRRADEKFRSVAGFNSTATATTMGLDLTDEENDLELQEMLALSLAETMGKTVQISAHNDNTSSSDAKHHSEVQTLSQSTATQTVTVAPVAPMTPAWNLAQAATDLYAAANANTPSTHNSVFNTSSP